MVAQAYGKGNVVSVRRSLRMGLWVVLAYWVIMLPAFFNSERILLAAGQKPEVAALAHGYILIGQFGVLPGLLYNVMRALVSAIGRAAVILNVTIAMLCLAGGGFGMMLFFSTSNTTVQTIVPDEMRGRVMGIWALIFGGMIPFGSLEAGAVAHYFGTAATLAVGAIVCALAAFVTLIIVRRRDAQLAAAG